MDEQYGGNGSSKKELIDLLERSSPHKYYVTQVSENVSQLANGVEYAFVEVTSDDGVQYGFQAYGEEASELNKIARNYLSRQNGKSVPISIF